MIVFLISTLFVLLEISFQVCDKGCISYRKHPRREAAAAVPSRRAPSPFAAAK